MMNTVLRTVVVELLSSRRAMATGKMNKIMCEHCEAESSVPSNMSRAYLKYRSENLKDAMDDSSRSDNKLSEARLDWSVRSWRIQKVYLGVSYSTAEWVGIPNIIWP